jgi:hypothetical protein
MSETLEQKSERNKRVQARYDELTHEAKHGHYETMFLVVREEVERERARCAIVVRRNFLPQALPSWLAEIEDPK